MQLFTRILFEQILNTKEFLSEKLTKINRVYALKIPILMYHHIDSASNSAGHNKLYTTKYLFNKEMEYLSQNKFVSITLDDLANALLNKKALPKKTIIITIDDGFEDIYTNAFPLLNYYKIKTTIFIITNTLDRKGVLSVPMIKEMINSRLISIGSHTINHKNLTKLDTERLKYELKESKNYLEKIFHVSVNSLAYPFGSYDKRVIKETIVSGYKNAVTTKYGKLHYQNKLYLFPRIRHGDKLELSDFIRRIH
jgi:peptidoglycan/xylan/chitin deacetylase (PgdA/CDA1 family)